MTNDEPDNSRVKLAWHTIVMWALVFGLAGAGMSYVFGPAARTLHF